MITCSVIIPTFNRLDDIMRCLPTLRAQDISGVDWEIIIVDNGSTDGTAEWGQAQVGDSNPRVRYVRETTPGLLSGRHRGAAEAAGDLLTFVDDDILATPGWLRGIVSAFEDPSVQIVGGPCLPNYEIAPPDWIEAFWSTLPKGGKFCSWLSLIDMGPQRMNIKATFVWGLNFSIRSSALQQLGGFHPDCIPLDLQKYQGDGETGLALKADALGFKSVFEPAALVYHRVPSARMTFDYFEKRAYYQGVCDSYTKARQENGMYGSKPQSALAKSLKGCLKKAARFLIYPWRNSKTEVDASSQSKIKRNLQAAYDRGFAFHQAAMEQDPIVRDWVLRPHYWDYTLPRS